MHFTCKIQTPLGEMLAASDGSALTGLWFEGQKHFAAGLNLPGEAKKLPLFDEVKRQLEDYFNGSLRRFSVALRPHGTPFCQSVWNLLEEIAYGKTVAYGELAARLNAETNRKTSARAVGIAVGLNPISIIIPCHRVVGAGGKLTGYAGGLERKRSLLKIEGVRLETLK